MKKPIKLKKMALLCLTLIGWAGAAQAETVNVSTQAEFASAYKTAANATDGTETTIVMAAGNYDGTDIRWQQLEIPMVRKVTLKVTSLTETLVVEQTLTSGMMSIKRFVSK